MVMSTFSFGAVFNLEHILLTLFITAISLLVYLFFISFRSNRNIPSINAIRQRKDNVESVIKNNGSNHQSIENVSVSIKDELSCSLPFVSIVVPARNEEESIERCLVSLLSQNYPKFEVIAVDDNSSDNTLEKMKGIRNKLQKQEISLPISSSRLKIISLKSKPENWTGKTWASQQGLLQSKGDILLFTDADTYYMRTDVLLISILYMLKENIDVLTAPLS